jgi:hypothetical protein
MKTHGKKGDLNPMLAQPPTKHHETEMSNPAIGALALMAHQHSLEQIQ